MNKNHHGRLKRLEALAAELQKRRAQTEQSRRRLDAHLDGMRERLRQYPEFRALMDAMEEDPELRAMVREDVSSRIQESVTKLRRSVLGRAPFGEERGEV